MECLSESKCHWIGKHIGKQIIIGLIYRSDDQIGKETDEVEEDEEIKHLFMRNK